MTADVAGFNRRTLVFDIGVAVGLWLIVATGVYVAKEAERASLDRPAAVADARAPVVDLAAATPRDKDDGHVLAAAPTASRIGALPIARPIRVHAPAVRSAQQAHTVDAVARRNEPVALADAERFDRCMPVCESRDPLIARAAVVQATYSTDAMIGGPFDDSADEHAVLDVGREVAERIVDLPRATLDTGKEALARLVRMVE